MNILAGDERNRRCLGFRLHHQLRHRRGDHLDPGDAGTPAVRLGFKRNPGFVGKLDHAIGLDVHLAGQNLTPVEFILRQRLFGKFFKLVGAAGTDPLAGRTGAFETIRQNAHLVLQGSEIEIVVFARIEFDDAPVFEDERYFMRCH